MSDVDVSENSNHQWRISLLGPFEIRRGSTVVRLRPQVAAMVSALVLERPREMLRSSFFEVLWEDPPGEAATSIRNLLSQLNKNVTTGLLAPKELTDASVSLAQGTITFDLDEFDSLLTAAGSARDRFDRESEQKSLEIAIALWRSPVLGDGFAGNPSWVLDAQLLWNRKLTEALLRLAELLDETGDDGAIVDLLKDRFESNQSNVRLVARCVEALYRLHQGPEALSLLNRAIGQWPTSNPPPPAWKSLAAHIESGEPLERLDNRAASIAPVLRIACEGFVGRRKELALLNTPFGSAISIEGQSGAGKTALIGELINRLLLRMNFDVAYVAGEASDQFPLQALSRAFSGVAPDLETFVQAVLSRSKEKPLLLVVDDMQWIDTQTLRVLDRLASLHVNQMLGIVTAGRPSVGTRFGRSASSFRETLVLGGFSTEELREFCETNLGCDVESLPFDVVAATGALPLPLQVMVTGGGDALLAKSSHVEQRVVQLAAMLGEQIDLDTLGTLTDLSKTEIASLFSNLEAIGLITIVDFDIRFRHALWRKAVIDSLGQVQRAELHKRIAEESRLPSWIRGRHAFHAIPFITLGEAMELAATGQLDAGAAKRFGDQADLAFERAEHLEGRTRIECLLEGVFAAEHAGRSGTSQLRIDVLNEAEVAKESRLALRAVLEPSAKGRNPLVLIDSRAIGRVLNLIVHDLANPKLSAEDRKFLELSRVRLRAERLTLAGLTGGIEHLASEVTWAEEYVSATTTELLPNVLRGLLSATVGSTDVALRSSRARRLFRLTSAAHQPTQQGISTALGDAVSDDLRSDSLGFLVRSVLEANNLPALHAMVAQFDDSQEPGRPADQWAFSVIRVVYEMLRGEPQAAMNLALHSASIGKQYALRDALSSWQLHCFALGRLGVTAPPDWEDPKFWDPSFTPSRQPNQTAFLQGLRSWRWAVDGSNRATQLLRFACEALNTASPDLFLLPALAVIVEASCFLGVPVSDEIIELLHRLDEHHIILGQTPVWSFGSASSLYQKASA
jgi:DNA-binding SARP family transcriptional activator